MGLNPGVQGQGWRQAHEGGYQAGIRQPETEVKSKVQQNWGHKCQNSEDQTAEAKDGSKMCLFVCWSSCKDGWV